MEEKVLPELNAQLVPVVRVCDVIIYLAGFFGFYVFNSPAILYVGESDEGKENNKSRRYTGGCFHLQKTGPTQLKMRVHMKKCVFLKQL